MNDCDTIEGFEHVVLQDSYVLDIKQTEDEIVFEVEFVVCEDAPQFQSPKPDEQYCYALGRIVFSGVTEVVDFQRTAVAFTDASGNVDLGNIDTFSKTHQGYELSGDWGKLVVTSSPPRLAWRLH
ncbi:hypothetical protein [Marimonas arenosa]|uniref:Uncharacterized protein n=1 Tax=Marimonas arenosa TaxID=1795305 RepID=A0AAE4B7V1_9RHOB|nr:hypothetical protein [Marimonas arenosa]MDQ2091941.1 hypothetical protein [Marimonas arenosa]